MTEIVHVLNRGVDKRKIFLDDRDYLRFIHDLFEFNNEENVSNVFFYFYNKRQTNDVGRHYYIRSADGRRPRKLLVDIYAFCLMPNHYHLLLSPKNEGTTSLFMKKLNGGYAKYFNEKYQRTGALFQGKFKRAFIKNEAHFVHLPYYIHLNPLDLEFPEWRERELSNYKDALSYLASYRWSSHLDYAGQKNFPSVTQRDFLLEFFGGASGYKSQMKQWLRDMDLEELKYAVLE